MTGSPLSHRLTGIAFIAFGLILLWFTTEKGHLVCERENQEPGVCQLERSTIYGHTFSATFTTDEIQSVRLRSYEMKRGTRNYAQVCLPGRNLLISDEGQSSREDALDAVNQLNTFKDSPEIKRLELTLGSEFYWRWGVLLFSVFGLFHLLSKGRWS